MDMSVENRERPESFLNQECSFCITSSPAPFFIDGPKGDVSENNNRCLRLQSGNILFQPLQLLVADHSESAVTATGFGIANIHEPDEMDTMVVKAVPTEAVRSLSVTF